MFAAVAAPHFSSGFCSATQHLVGCVPATTSSGLHMVAHPSRVSSRHSFPAVAFQSNLHLVEDLRLGLKA